LIEKSKVGPVGFEPTTHGLKERAPDVVDARKTQSYPKNLENSVAIAVRA